MIRMNTPRSNKNSNLEYRRLDRLDIYRKVPIDLLEGSKRGSIISWMALLVMATLVILETKVFLTSTLVKELSLDSSIDSKLHVYFNITMMDLRCEFATIDVVSFLGKQQNVTKNIKKVALDASGVQQHYVRNRNPMQHDIELSDKSVTQSIEELHENGEHAILLDEETFDYALNEYDFVYVDFYASWCSHCRIFAPTWENFAELMDSAAEREVQTQLHNSGNDTIGEDKEELKEEVRPAFVGKVDCVIHNYFCMRQAITGYPTVRLYIRGNHFGDYWGHRTILGLMQFLKLADDMTSTTSNSGQILKAEKWITSRRNISENERKWAEDVERKRHQHYTSWNPSEHPGCQISGILFLDRTPGNFYIQAQSPNHNLNPSLTNVSHLVEYLVFSTSNRTDEVMQALYPKKSFFSRRDQKIISFFRPQFYKPMNGNAYITKGLHEAYHHYMKLVSTNLDFYQLLVSSQLTYYTQKAIPEAKFQLDLSPIQVTYSQESRALYEYITSLMAILGGTFTVVGMIDSALGILMTSSPR